MGYGTLVKKQFTVPKLSFYFIFWSIHFFLFGFGWYGLSPLPARRSALDANEMTGTSKRPILGSRVLTGSSSPCGFHVVQVWC